MDIKDTDKIVEEIMYKKDKAEINSFISDYMPFIIKTVSDSKKSYVEIENDDELSIGMIAFNEAMEKFDISKGHFIPFAKMVIQSRLNSYYANNNKHPHIYSDSLNEDLSGDYQAEEEKNDLTMEISEFERELNKFGLDFEFFTRNTPKHRDTKEKAIEIAEKTNNEPDLVDFVFEKHRLPISKMAERFFISVKFLKGSKYLIIATLIVLRRNFSIILKWIKK